MVNTIAFPGLSLGPFHISESFEIFGISIHLYGVIIAQVAPEKKSEL